MNLSIQQIFDIKIILSGKKKSELAELLNVTNSNQFSTIERYKGLQDKLNEYFNKVNPAINEIVRNITGFDDKSLDKITGNEPYGSEFQKKYNELQERLLESHEKRLKYFEEERQRIIEKYGDIFSK